MSPQNRTFMPQTKAQARWSVNNQSSRWSSGPCGTSGTTCALKPTPTAVTFCVARKPLERAVVEAAAIAQAPALLVAGEQRHEQRIGLDDLAPGRRMKRAEHARLERIARPPGAKDQRLPLARPRRAARAGSPARTARPSAGGCRAPRPSARNPTRRPASRHGRSRRHIGQAARAAAGRRSRFVEAAAPARAWAAQGCACRRIRLMSGERSKVGRLHDGPWFVKPPRPAKAGGHRVAKTTVKARNSSQEILLAPGF